MSKNGKYVVLYVAIVLQIILDVRISLACVYLMHMHEKGYGCACYLCGWSTMTVTY